MCNGFVQLFPKETTSREKNAPLDREIVENDTGVVVGREDPAARASDSELYRVQSVAGGIHSSPTIFHILEAELSGAQIINGVRPETLASRGAEHGRREIAPPFLVNA